MIKMMRVDDRLIHGQVAVMWTKELGIENDPRAAAMKILVISNTPEDLLKVAEKIQEKPILNVANYGRIGGGNLSEKIKVTETVYVTEHDKEVLKSIREQGIEIIHQPLPSDTRADFMKILEGK